MADARAEGGQATYNTNRAALDQLKAELEGSLAEREGKASEMGRKLVDAKREYADEKAALQGQINGLQATMERLNTELERCTDYVRSPDQNLLFTFGIQGVIDELKIYSSQLSDEDVSKIYAAFNPADKKSPIAIGILPGEPGKAKKFGAYYKTLP